MAVAVDADPDCHPRRAVWRGLAHRAVAAAALRNSHRWPQPAGSHARDPSGRGAAHAGGGLRAAGWPRDHRDAGHHLAQPFVPDPHDRCPDRCLDHRLCGLARHPEPVCLASVRRLRLALGGARHHRPASARPGAARPRCPSDRSDAPVAALRRQGAPDPDRGALACSPGEQTRRKAAAGHRGHLADHARADGQARERRAVRHRHRRRHPDHRHRPERLCLLHGAIGLGLGFGLQKVVSNLVSGVILLADRSIKPGDVISVGDTFGWIAQLGARYVSVVTRDGRSFLIPNEDLITNRVINWSFSTQTVRLEVAFGVAYDSDPHLVRQIAVAAAKTVSRVHDMPPPVCHISGFGESSIDFVLRFWINDPVNGVANVKGDVFLALWDSFRERGITIPFPQMEMRVTRAR
ncbi:MAG: mechanosensitive ion channel [Blastochloris sp.]|nr:mechanosensitive ion channel [Blastochloris sp.]